MGNIAKLTIAEAAPLIAAKKLSPVELVQACLERIEKYDKEVQAWVTVLPEQALAAAKIAEAEIMAGNYRGTLHGIPYGAKDIYLTKGVRTAAGSLVNPDHVPDEDATVVRLLAEAGAILLGKTTTAEYAFLWGINKTRNPWNTNHTPGGSSTGSGAAVGADMAMFALGSQTVGSLLRPAAYNNLTCMKATYGRISCHNVMPCSYSLDHAGALTKSVADTAIVNQVLFKHDPADYNSLVQEPVDLVGALSKDAMDFTVGVPDSFFTPQDEIIAQKFEEALEVLEALGVTIKTVPMPKMMDEAFAAQDIVMCAEAASYHEPLMQQALDKYFVYTRTQLLIGKSISAQDYLKAQRIRRIFAQEMLKMYEGVDLVLAPTTLTLPPEGFFTGSPMFNGPFTNAGLPTMTVPVGFDLPTHLPVGMQITAPYLQEEKIIALGSMFQKYTSWHLCHALD